MHMIQSYMLFLKKKQIKNEEKRGVMLELLSFYTFEIQKKKYIFCYK